VSRRGQASLPPLAVALVVLTGATLLGLTLASGALASADRAAEERGTAVALGERLIAPDSPLTDRANVLDQARLDGFDTSQLRTEFPVADGADVEISVGGNVSARTDEAVRGTTVRRLVLVAETNERTLRPSLGSAEAVTLPRRTGRVEVTIAPPANTSVETVREGERVVLRDPSGLRGTFDVSLSRRETARLAFDANRSLVDGSVQLTVPTARTTKTTLAVTVDG